MTDYNFIIQVHAALDVEELHDLHPIAERSGELIHQFKALPEWEKKWRPFAETLRAGREIDTWTGPKGWTLADHLAIQEFLEKQLALSTLERDAS